MSSAVSLLARNHRVRSQALFVPSRTGLRLLVHSASTSASTDSGHETTLNGFGVMMSAHDPFEKAWVAAASQLEVGTSAMEIGACFGRATLSALERGCPHVVCNDIHDAHLAEVVQRRLRLVHNSSAAGLLSPLPGAVPAVIESWQPSTPLRAVLAANVLHFLSPMEIRRTLSRLHEVCASGCELFVSLDTPWTSGFRPLSPLYAARKLVGDPHPGYTRFSGPLRRALPTRLRAVDTYHPMEAWQLRRMLEQTGWHVIDAHHFPGDATRNPDGVSMGNGVEMVGAHAIKHA